MKKENKVWLPIVIVLAVLVVAVFVGAIVVKSTVGKHNLKKGSGEVVKASQESNNDENSDDAFKADDKAFNANIQVEVYSLLESPDAYIIEMDPMWTYGKNDVEGLSAEELFYAWNEIYARCGATFEDAKVQAFFDAKTWYVKGTKTTADLDKEFATSYYAYKDNVAFIQNYMTENNLTFTP